jgi:hypothetical protein
VGFQFLDEAKRVFEFPATATSTQGYLGLAAIIVATILACYLGYRGYKWVSAANQAMQEIKTKPVGRTRSVESGSTFIPGGEPITVTSKLLAGLEFYPSRKELPSIEGVIETAKSSVDVLAFTVEHWADAAGPIAKAVGDDAHIKHFRFILLNPESRFMKEVVELNKRTTIPDRISESLDKLQKIKNGLNDIQKGRLDIRIHDSLPIHSIIAIDAESDSGLIYVENYIHDSAPRQWVTLRISRKEQGELFQKYWQGYQYIWERSKAWS